MDIVIRWHVDDVLDRHTGLSVKQAMEVLQACKDNHDAAIGINWDVIDAEAAKYETNS